MYECEAATKKCVESKKGTESKTKCEETCKPPPPPTTKYICDVTSAKCMPKTNGPETKSNCEKTCKHWVPPVLRDIQVSLGFLVHFAAKTSYTVLISLYHFRPHTWIQITSTTRLSTIGFPRFLIG
jgi:hypothetical protein